MKEIWKKSTLWDHTLPARCVALSHMDGANDYTPVKSSRIYTGQYTFPILLLNDDNMLGEHKGREKNIVYGRLF